MDEYAALVKHFAIGFVVGAITVTLSMLGVAIMELDMPRET